MTQSLKSPCVNRFPLRRRSNVLFSWHNIIDLPTLQIRLKSGENGNVIVVGYKPKSSLIGSSIFEPNLRGWKIGGPYFAPKVDIVTLDGGRFRRAEPTYAPLDLCRLMSIVLYERTVILNPECTIKKPFVGRASPPPAGGSQSFTYHVTDCRRGTAGRTKGKELLPAVLYIAAVRRVQRHTGLTHHFYFLTFGRSGVYLLKLLRPYVRFWGKNAINSISAGAPPQFLLGELTALPSP